MDDGGAEYGLRQVLLIHKGKVRATMKGHDISMKIRGGQPGAFIGEASFLEVWA